MMVFGWRRISAKSMAEKEGARGSIYPTTSRTVGANLCLLDYECVIVIYRSACINRAAVGKLVTGFKSCDNFCPRIDVRHSSSHSVVTFIDIESKRISLEHVLVFFFFFLKKKKKKKKETQSQFDHTRASKVSFGSGKIGMSGLVYWN